MGTFRKKKRLRKRKCKCCVELYLPDYRNRHHQQYCSKAACRHASKNSSQHRWVLSKKGHDYFTGKENVDRVKQWRIKNPGRGRNHKAAKQKVLQDVCSSQPILNQIDTMKLKNSSLQDICSLQLPLIIGLISNLTGNTLQDDIAATSQKFINLGYDILGSCSNSHQKGR